MPANDASMVAAAGVVGVNSHLFGPISTEVSAFGVFKEAYYNAPIDSAKFYIGTIGPNAQFGPLNIKALAQIWYVEACKGPVAIPTTYAQLGAGATVSF